MYTTCDTCDRYTPDAGTADEPVICGVCGDAMECVRNSRGPRGWAQAVAMHMRGETDTGTPHDIFSCPNSETDWHKQVIALRREGMRSPSKVLEGMLRDEARTILERRQCTKKVPLF
jgi:hypothetical protein